MANERRERVHGYKNCTIHLKSQQTRNEDGSPGKWIPKADIMVHHGPSVTFHPVSWPNSLQDTIEEADRFALAGAAWWVENDA